MHYVLRELKNINFSWDISTMVGLSKACHMFCLTFCCLGETISLLEHTLYIVYALNEQGLYGLTVTF